MRTQRRDLRLFFRSIFGAGICITVTVCGFFSNKLIAEESDTVLHAAENRLLDRLWQMPFVT